MGKRSHSTSGETESARKQRKEAKRAKRSSTTPQKTRHAETSDVFIRKQLEMTVSLLPGALRDVRKSVEDSLRSFLLKFSDGVGGILLAFENVRVLGKGEILNELPYIHYQVACDALVFAPRQGCQLTGVVTESFHSHLSLVVHGYFNANIRADYLRKAGFEFDAELMQWSREGDEDEDIEPLYFSQGKTVQYVVEKVHESGGIISLDGSLPASMAAQ